MNNQPNALVQKKKTVAELLQAPSTMEQIAKVLPKHVTPERMTRVALTATMKNPALLECTTASLMNALLICSQAGLEPDGRLAHLIPFKDQVQVIFDYKGLVALAIRNGADSVFADKVCEHDDFEAGVVNGHKVLNHKPRWSDNRGTVICYYCVCKRGGEVDWEVMTVAEVETIRKRSRAANSGPWVTDFDEMAKKTVIRRMSKRWDLLPEIRDVIYSDDDVPESKPTVTTPLFKPKSVAENAPVIEISQPTDESVQPDAPQEAASEPEKPKSHLKAVRNLCATAKVKEGELLDYLTEIGTTDGSFSDLDDLPEITLRLVHDQWAGEKGLAAAIVAGRKGVSK